MITLKVNVKDNISPNLKKKMAQLDKVPNQAYQFFKAVTPIRTGNARANTRLSNETIIAGYSYAQPLDNGRSMQAPRGMSIPTKSFIKKTADSIMKRK